MRDGQETSKLFNYSLVRVYLSTGGRRKYVGHNGTASKAKGRVRRQTLLGKTVGLRSFKLSLNFLQSSLPAMVILIATGTSADDIEL